MINSEFSSLSFAAQIESIQAELYMEFLMEGGMGRSFSSFWDEAAAIVRSRQDRVINPQEADDAREDYLASFE